ncbi:retron system putative HNH endonuclease [Pseudomonas sp. ABY48]|uniref:retron system putative HNH endonuclease n=1 Tax=Pseudomonas sp. ABY48 TaxID=3402865 RepID=UPI003B42DF27
MIELVHNPVTPKALHDFLITHPQAGPADFNNRAFGPVKSQVKASLHADQGGLCAYCEVPLAPTEGQIDHIKPKAGPNAHPHLTFAYTNYAHGCIRRDGCGQKKKDGVLPIEPSVGCNEMFSLTSDGALEPMPLLTKNEKHRVRQTRDMLGLQSPTLVNEREKWIKALVAVMKEEASATDEFMRTIPFRHILLRLFR